MDFAFAPGIDTAGNPYNGVMRILLGFRNNTRLVHGTAFTTVASFISEVNTNAAYTKPADNLLIASHGNDAGWLEIQMDASSGSDIDYERLEQIVTRNSLALPAGLLSATGFIHIKGCRIGQAGPFLQLLKTAFGGTNQITAPKFFHNVMEITGRESQVVGAIEFFEYSFKIANKTQHTTKAQVVAAFQAKNYTFYDGTTAVPATAWDAWVPRNRNVNDRTTVLSKRIRFNPRLPNLPERTNLDFQFRHRVYTTPEFRLNYPSGPIPSGETARMAELRTLLSGTPRFQATHAFPVYRRLDYATFDEYMDGLQWSFRVDGTHLVCTGTRHEYTAMPLVTTVGTDDLVFNYHPDTSVAAAGAAITGFLESNAHFFTTTV